MINRYPDNPELLAPAGSMESFHAAIEAGADAVYLGLDDFNARLRAKNFSIKTLSYLLPYAHARQVKIYVTLNTLIKQAELEPLIHTLYQLEQIGVDAIIVADLGLIEIGRAFFPKLTLHASTQMTIHNSAGLRQTETLGLRRAVLSRELTLQEVQLLARTSAIELELFVHGALCYGISGLCLASSFLGGSSGNRGRCTQVCRRKFETGATQGYFFSPDDLCALDFLPQIIAINAVRSLKIEGRMKGPEYVYSVVKAFRMALDDPGHLPAAKEIAVRDFGRRKTALFLGGLHTPGIIDASEQSGIGERAGKITGLAPPQTIIAASTVMISANDRIRIQPESGFEGESATVQSSEKNGDTVSVVLKKPVACSVGDTVYLIGRSTGEVPRKVPQGADDTIPVPFKISCPFAGRVAASFRPPPESETAVQRETLWIKIDNLAWLDYLHATPCQRLVLAGRPQEMQSLLEDPARLKSWRSRLVPSLPPFISENDLPSWNMLIGRFKTAGVTTWFCSNIGHRTLFGKEFTLIADAPMACLNRASQKAIRGMGFTNFTHSLEDDYLNIKATATTHGLAYLFSYPPLFISRIHPAVKPGEPFSDPHDNRFFTAQANGLHYLLAQKPLCLTHRRKKLSEAGIKNFIIDLSFCRFDPDFLQTLIDCYRNGTRLPGSSVFNFKGGLR